ncbi:ABC transporter permease [Alisedimentitalea sp. MJ-SS2]|uniref:ABC transporter permease n=1 Tax=Aliisedimentitalea sp. MJ-SS2 TaxID=3049795 RepID=UPI00290B72B8|nr:ABC transporter permease [Alisedimentitalea sp. MJ-SS2]MDU8930038.1 ABC transporter permease [Alisedimentitalea sp. MJ-SS2]
MSAPTDPSLPTPLPTAGPGTTRPFATPRTVMALVLREMSTRYGRSPGGYVWAILEPLGSIIVLGLGFSLLLRSPSLGSSFILFYATGYLPFNLYQSLSLTISRAISFSKPLLFYPAVTWVDAVLARFILNSLTGILVTYLLLAGILAVADTRVVLDAQPMLVAIGQAMILGLGVGVLNCALIGLMPTWEMVWSIFTRPLFLASGIFYIYEDLPQMAQDILWYNPLMHVTGYMRMGFYPMYEPEYLAPAYAVGFGLICLTMGLILLGRYHRDILND